MTQQDDSSLIGKEDRGESSPDKARAIGRLTTDFLLRALLLAAESHNGDIFRAVIGAAIVSANTSHLNSRPSTLESYDDLRALPPDSERRPVSVLALSKSLGLPFETTRRHVNALMAHGYCVRVRGGVIVPSSVIGAPENTKALAANAANVRRFLREMRRAGVTAD